MNVKNFASIISLNTNHYMIKKTVGNGIKELKCSN